jgi:CheY-like chemotaxis protein
MISYGRCCGRSGTRRTSLARLIGGDVTTLLSSRQRTSSATLAPPEHRGEGPIVKSKRTILVVDDDPDIRELIQLTLTAFGYVSQAASDADEALAKILRGEVSLITLDLAMPRRDGHWLLRELARDPTTREIPVIVVSAYAGRLERTPQVIAVLWKPYDVDELGRAVEAALGSPDATP